MNQQPSAVDFVAVPAAVVVGSMLGIEQPLEMHRVYIPDNTAGDELADFGMVGCIAIVERNPNGFPRALLGIQNCLGFLAVGGDGFLANYITAFFHGTDDVLVVVDASASADKPVERLIPFVSAVVKDVDRDAAVVSVDWDAQW